MERFDLIELTRRQWLGGAAALGAAAALPAWAQGSEPWSNLRALVTRYVEERKVSGMGRR